MNGDGLDIVPRHVDEVRARRLPRVDKVETEVTARHGAPFTFPLPYPLRGLNAASAACRSRVVHL